MLIPHTSSLMALTRFLIDGTVGALGTKFSARPPVAGGVANGTAAGVDTGVATVGISVGC